MKQTAVEWLIEQMFKQGYFDGNKPLSITNLDHLEHQAKEMEKQQIIDAHMDGYESISGQSVQYYNETYGSKGSDENFKQFSLYEHKETIATADTPTSSQTEISDKEMIQAAIKHSKIYTLKFIPRSSFIHGAKWYREQLKSKQ